MAEPEKRVPQSITESGRLATALESAAQAAIDRDLTLAFRVSGGVPGQRYRLDVRIIGRTLEEARLDCEMTDRHRRIDRHDDDELVPTLSRRLLASGVLETVAEPPRFLPDTLVGIITISSGDAVRRIFFAADPDQAAVQGLSPTTSVLDAAEALYETASRVLDVDARP